MAKDNSTKYLAYGLIALAVGVGIYVVTQDNGTTSPTNTNVPNGGIIHTTNGSYQNTTGEPVWVTATGVVFNGLGDLLGNVNDILQTVQGSGGGNTAVTGIGYLHNYYNPLPGALM